MQFLYMGLGGGSYMGLGYGSYTWTNQIIVTTLLHKNRWFILHEQRFLYIIHRFVQASSIGTTPLWSFNERLLTHLWSSGFILFQLTDLNFQLKKLRITYSVKRITESFYKQDPFLAAQAPQSMWISQATGAEVKASPNYALHKLSLHENVVYSVCAHMGNAAYILTPDNISGQGEKA